MLILALAAAAVVSSISVSPACINHTGSVPSFYEREPYRRSIVSTGEPAFVLAESCSPPPCPLALATLPIPAVTPPEARGGAAWLARHRGGVRERRCIRDGVERKDANARA